MRKMTVSYRWQSAGTAVVHTKRRCHRPLRRRRRPDTSDRGRGHERNLESAGRVNPREGDRGRRRGRDRVIVGRGRGRGPTRRCVRAVGRQGDTTRHRRRDQNLYRAAAVVVVVAGRTTVTGASARGQDPDRGRCPLLEGRN